MPRPVDLAWNANLEADVNGYTLYVGDGPPGVYTQTQDMGNNTSGSFVITHDGRWRFALVARDTEGNISAFSAEVNDDLFSFFPASLSVRKIAK